MNKYFKKFGIMFVMLLAIIGVGIIQHGSIANAVTVGQQLTSPESGWARFQFGNPYIKLQGDWSSGYTRDTSSTIEFKFYGNCFRIMSFGNTDWSNDIEISIDGKVSNFSEYSTSGKSYLLVFQSDKLENESHSVSMHNKNSGSAWHIQAIDIDDDGYLLPYDESITLDQSSMDMTEGDTKQLTATTTPAAVGVTWTSSDSSVATVDSDGKVTGIKEGTCTITATTTDGSNLSASCTVTVTPKGTEPSNPTDPTGDANLYIELVDGQIKQYTVSSDEINKFTEWYENRDKDHSLKATYKFTKGTYTDYVVHDQIDWFEVR